MGFEKPFRADPVRLGPYHAEQKRHRSLAFAAKVLGGAVAFGLLIGFATSGRWPAPEDSLPKASAPTPLPRADSPPAGAYYPRCDAARAAGVAPILVGEPGYRPELDADSDGIACEPYLGN